MTPHITLKPHHRQRLNRLFMRLQQQGRDDAQQIVRAELRGVIAPNGVARPHTIPPAAGDVVGEIGSLEVVGIQHHLIAAGTPATGDSLVFSATDHKLHWAVSSGGSGSGTGRWEPVTNGDADFPDLIYEDGDIVMELVS